MDYNAILTRIYNESKDLAKQGKVATYIPALAQISPEKYGLSLITTKNEQYNIGDFDLPFSIQSISKVFTFSLVYSKLGHEIWNRIGKEPSGTAFNSLIQLEHEHGIPRNPFINAGAIVVADILLSLFPDPKKVLLEFICELANDYNIKYNEKVAISEKEYGHRNYALAHFMKSFGNIHHPVEDVLDIYFHQCSIEMSTEKLAKSMLFLANDGIVPHSDKQIITRSQAKRLKAMMLTTGLYNESGEFAFRVGMPAKSGVGGGIIAVIPNVLTIATWSPPLNNMGNSIAGIDAMERLTTYTGQSIF
ncbi:MAG: glutaminase [Ignavibacteria bacterium]|nr:glutaminase [Ignavibacteria bacterium]